jgi:hypothetical protein
MSSVVGASSLPLIGHVSRVKLVWNNFKAICENHHRFDQNVLLACDIKRPGRVAKFLISHPYSASGLSASLVTHGSISSSLHNIRRNRREQQSASCLYIAVLNFKISNDNQRIEATGVYVGPLSLNGENPRG